MEQINFLKTGWPFLPVIGENGARMNDLTYDMDIYESLKILFSTLPGERIAHPLYGCDLLQFMFKPINNSLLSQMDNTIVTAITLYETRINIIDLVIQVNGDQYNRIDIELIYQISTTSSRYNMTIPFYIMEGFAEI